MDAPFEPFDPAMDTGAVDELRVRRLSAREDRVDPELARLRTALADSAARIAELEDVLSATRTRLTERVQEASSLAAHRALAEQLQAELAREREARRHAEDLLAGERDRFARVLAASQLELRDELDRVRSQGRAALDAARSEGVALREQLAAAAAELDRVAEERRAAGIERAALEQELRAAQVALAERPDADELRAELAARAAAQERAVAELAAVRTGPPPAPLVPPADHPALGNVPDRRAVPDSVIADLARAAERLRELAERGKEDTPATAEAEVEAEDAAEARAKEGAASPGAAAAPAAPVAAVPDAPAAASRASASTDPVAAPPVAAVPDAPAAAVPDASAAASRAPASTDPVAAGPAAAAPAAAAPVAAAPDVPAAPAAAAPAAAAPAAVASEPRAREAEPQPEAAPLQPLLPPLTEQPTAIAWLAPALAELAREDGAAARRLLLDLLPVQGLSARRALTYAVESEDGRVHLVHVARGRATVERDVGPGADVPVRIAGPVAALAPLVAGGRTRPQGARITGRRRRLRRLLRDARAPIGLPELARAGIRPEPADLLALLAASVRPDRTRGTSAVVSYVLGGTPEAAVVVADGAPLVVLPDAGGIRATAEVHAAHDGLLEVLAGTGEAQARGDLQAVERLHRWLRRAQGLDA